jgi:hypothetical protein
MHAAVPIELRDPITGMTYTWRLHWKQQLRREDHMSLTVEANDTKATILNTSLIYLIEDLERAAVAFFNTQSNHKKNRAIIEQVHEAAQTAPFSI